MILKTLKHMSFQKYAAKRRNKKKEIKFVTEN